MVAAFGVRIDATQAVLTKTDEWRGEPQIAWVDFFHKDADGNAQTFHWSELPVAGPTYYLEPRAIQLGVCERKASERGQLEGSTFSFQVADTDNAIREFFGNANQVNVFDVEVVVKLERVVDFMAGLDPIIAFRGLVKKYKASGRTVSFDCQDWLTARIGQDIALPRAGTDFPGTPLATRERVGPLVYGALSDEGSNGAGPINAAESASETGQAFPNGAGYGQLGGTPPTGTAAGDAGASGTLAAGTYYAMATTVKNGIESDPFPFYGESTVGGVSAAGVSVTVAGGHAVTASCDNMGAAADTYRFYLGTFGSDYFWPVMVESATPSATFTSIDPTVQAGGIATATGIFAYAASFLYSDGETPLTTDVDVIYIGLRRGYRRPIRLVFEPPGAGVVGMRVYRKYASGPYDRVWTVPLAQLNGDGNLYFEDDLLDTGASYITGAPTPVGKLVPFYVGTFVSLLGWTMHGFAIAGHACADPAVINVYLDDVAVDPGYFGIYIFAPGQAGFPTHFGASTYRVGAAGNRWTLFYMIGPDADAVVAGTKRLAVNVNGVEDVGDGSGTRIDSLNLQPRHFAKNFIMGDAQWIGDVNWLGMPTWADGQDKIDDDSFDAAETKAALQIGDTAGARALTAIRPLLEILSEMAVDADAAYGFTRIGKFKWFLEDPDPFAVAADTIDEIQDTAVDSFQTTDETDPTWFHNRVPYSFNAQYGGDGAVALKESAVADDEVSQLRYGKNWTKRVIEAPSALQFFGRQNASAVRAILTRYRARHANPPRHVDQALGMFWFVTREIGEVVGVTNSEGVAAAGWTHELVRIRQIAGDLGSWQVQMRCRQLSTALLVTLSTYLVEEFMSDIDLGGVWAGSPADLTTAASQTVLPVEYRDRLVQWPVVPATATVKARVYCKVDDAALTITPEIYNLTDSAVVVTGTPVTATSFGAAQELVVPRPVDDESKEYRLRATVAGGNVVDDPTRTVGLLGALRVIFP
jgi:hypothetical protein